MSPEKADFPAEKGTMLITLYAKVLQSRSADPILRDPWGEEAVGRIDHDFEALRVSRWDSLSIAMRARQFDVLTCEFLGRHPDATVLHLGCGLDSRVYRVDPTPAVRWFDADYPDVIELRRRLYPERAGYRTIGSSLADLGWLDEVPSDRPALILAEGVTMYLTEDVIKPLLNRLVDHFPTGELVFDAHSRQLVRFVAKMRGNVRGTGATFGWGLDDPREIARLEPRLELIEEVRIPDFEGFAKLPWKMRAALRLMDALPPLRRRSRPLRWRF